MRLDSRQYEVRWFDPRSEEYSGSQNVSRPVWPSVWVHDGADWVMFMKRHLKQLKSYLIQMAELLGAWSEDCLSSQ